ncbi:MAG TPA: hypothetical protein GX405_06155 [Rhizobiales bacterium]|nr:hypothetical protein [Hyphomicrobiales bacterium]
MNQEVQKHEKIRFRRGEIAELHALPSAQGQGEWRRRTALSLALRYAGAAFGVLGCVAILLAAAIYLVGVNGIGTDTVRDEAEVAVEHLLGIDLDASLGPARLSFDRERFLAVEIEDALFRTATQEVVRAGSVRIGLRPLALLAGRIEVGSVRIENARIAADVLPEGDGNWMAALANADGLIDPDLVSQALLSALHLAIDAIESGTTRAIELSAVEIALPHGGGRTLAIDGAALRVERAGELSVAMDAEFAGRTFKVAGTARREAAPKRISALDLTVEAVQDAEGAGSPVPTPAEGDTRIGSLKLHISGEEGIRGEASRFAIAASLTDAVIPVDATDSIAGDAEINAALLTGSGKLEIARARLTVGRSRFEFHGAVGPRPHAEGEAPAYRYEFVSDGSYLSPGDSTEPALQFLSRVAGNYDPASRRLSLDELRIRTAGGELSGKAAFDIVGDGAPGISLALSVPRMPVAHVKVLWPWLAAGTARHWAMNNLFGGNVTNSTLRYEVAPRRLGNGVPLSGDEVSGHFEIAGARFDVAGRIPPIRDAIGRIDFRGNDVDIALASGVVYLPSGRMVAARDGTLIIRNAHIAPTIGKLDMNVEGAADAVTELASYEPIDAMRHIGMTADEFSGQVSGNVKADIPLYGVGADVPLDWLVALDFRDLDVARPFDGQLATEATGSITLDPTRAVIRARARLNGAPAEIDMVEPIGESGVARERRISVVLDNKAREAIAPGLAMLLDGPTKVLFGEGAPAAPRRIEADLTDTQLTIPWAGWSKGPGIAAKASFTLETTGDRTTLRDFKLSGQTFAIEGEFVLLSGDLVSANLATVRLNRGDDVRVAIRRDGKGYAVDVAGESLDARSLIKTYLSDSGSAAKATGSAAVTVNGEVSRVAGFNGAGMTDVKLSYSGTGAVMKGMKFEAATSRGGRVAVTSGGENGGRTMEMQSNDAGAILKFLDIYPHMEGGTIRLALAGDADGPMKGQVDATDFWVVNEPKLASIVATPPAGDQRSLNQALRGEIDTSRVRFERGFSVIEKGPGSLKLERGVLRGPVIGLIFQGTLYDRQGNMDMTGTFMPAYGLNRIFGEIPLFGQILGNGSDRGLIGVTFRLAGDANSPNLQVNPLSVIAPGIFRSIFEFRG